MRKVRRLVVSLSRQSVSQSVKPSPISNLLLLLCLFGIVQISATLSLNPVDVDVDVYASPTASTTSSSAVIPKSCISLLSPICSLYAITSGSFGSVVPIVRLFFNRLAPGRRSGTLSTTPCGTEVSASAPRPADKRKMLPGWDRPSHRSRVSGLTLRDRPLVLLARRGPTGE